jgi:DNA-binding MurR/RpiR family transcriptional regulator
MADHLSERTIWQLVRAQATALTAAERRVARALLAAYPIAGLETVTELANRAGVSGPTVTRFVSRLGFAGYREFQRTLRREVQARMSSPLVRYDRAPGAEDVEGILSATLGDFMRLLPETFAGIPRAEFDAVVDLLADERRRVLLVGGRLSHVAAAYLFSRLHQLRAGCRLVDRAIPPLVDELMELSKRDVLVVFDYRRYQTDVVAFAHGAAERGATVVLLTDPWLSPIAEVSARVLTSVGQTSSPFDSLVGSVAVVEALVAALLARHGDAARVRMGQLDVLRADVIPQPAPQSSNATPLRRRSTRRSNTSGRA